ncbi:toprim domain-containing protein [Ralstonia solanacearum]|uniref:DUF7146 domain-containing protein n=1 Tax=Ralstonia solanacearum TaxID=305 RepID=UPI0005AC9900|nr:toprim domain-containing protein [Ralstonia solanacearum]MDC6177812.1 toprim domain-containing protein [Ralstonia solanacearum]MDC6238124.1 toprim domain-containing protein [Ralstonia solanacearum]
MIAWTHYDTGNHRIPCPACGRGERDKTLGLTIEADGKGVAHCFRCAFTESYRSDRGARQQMPAATRIKAVTTQKHETLSEYGRDLWSACKPLSGAAAAYLMARRCAIPPADGDLRWHPALKHPSGYTGPALIGRITDAVTRQQLSLHRTWVQADGCKADVDPPRLLLGGHRKQGGVIRLWPDEAVTVGLGIAEGIETALSLAWAYAPVWACIDAGNLAAFPVLPGIEALTIGADNDAAGAAAAQECAARWANADREVYITRQTQNDLNDILKEAA